MKDSILKTETLDCLKMGGNAEKLQKCLKFNKLYHYMNISKRSSNIYKFFKKFINHLKIILYLKALAERTLCAIKNYHQFY